MTHTEKAVNYFSQKLHCSQSVLAAYAEECGITEEKAIKLGSCLGTGMRKGEVCGAVTGALMVLGLLYGQNKAGDVEGRQRSNEVNDLMMNRFKEKPVLMVDVRNLFFDEGKGFCFDYCLRNFDEKFSRYFEPVYIWTGEKITDFQRKEFFQNVNGKPFYHAGDYFNPGFVQCFYISKTLEPKFIKAFRQFYAVTFLLYTGNMESILEIARDMYKTLIAKEKCIFKGNYISAFNYSENIFEVNRKALSKLHVMDMRYLLENDYFEVMDNFVYDNEAPEDCYFSFYRRNDEVIMAGVFPDDCHLYQKWSRVANIFYDYTGRIPTEITASPDIWNEDDIEEIITDRILNEADELTVIDGDECYAFLDFLDRRKFKQKKLYYGRQIIGEDADSVGPKNRAWFSPQLYDEKFNFGKTEVDVVLDEHFPENCYVIYSGKGEED